MFDVLRIAVAGAYLHVLYDNPVAVADETITLLFGRSRSPVATDWFVELERPTAGCYLDSTFLAEPSTWVLGDRLARRAAA